MASGGTEGRARGKLPPTSTVQHAAWGSDYRGKFGVPSLPPLHASLSLPPLPSFVCVLGPSLLPSEDCTLAEESRYIPPGGRPVRASVAYYARDEQEERERERETAPREIAGSVKQVYVGERGERGQRAPPHSILGQRGRRLGQSIALPRGKKKLRDIKRAWPQSHSTDLVCSDSFFHCTMDGKRGRDQSESARRSALACPMGRKTEWAVSSAVEPDGGNGKKAEEIPLPIPHRSWASQK